MNLKRNYIVQLLLFSFQLLYTSNPIIAQNGKTLEGQTLVTYINDGTSNGPSEVGIRIKYVLQQFDGSLYLRVAPSIIEDNRKRGYYYEGKQYFSTEIPEIYSGQVKDINLSVSIRNNLISTIDKNITVTVGGSNSLLGINSFLVLGKVPEGFFNVSSMLHFDVNYVTLRNFEVVQNAIKLHIRKMAEQEEAKRHLAEYNQLMKDGKDLFIQKKYDQALEVYREALKKKVPNNEAQKWIDDIKNKKEEEIRIQQVEAKASALKKEQEGEQKESDGKVKNSSKDGKKAEEEQKSAAQKKEEEEQKSAAHKKAEEEEIEKRRKEEEARLAEERRLQAIEEEKARQKRVEEYNDRHEQMTNANTAAAAIVLMYSALLHYKLAKTIFTKFPDYMQSSIRNYKEPDNLQLALRLGYGISSNPIMSAVTTESYDGYTYSYDTDSTIREVATLDINVGMEFWPLYGKYLGFGIIGKLKVGHGFTAQDIKFGYNIGAQWYAGARAVKFYQYYKIGGDFMSYTPWISSKKSGGGTVNSMYLRNEFGLRFTINPNVVNNHSYHLSLGVIFNRLTAFTYDREFPQTKFADKGFTIRLENDAGVGGFIECIPSLPAYNNQNTYAELVDATYRNRSFYISVGVHASIAKYGKKNIQYSDRALQVMRDRDLRNFISFMSPQFSFISSRNTDYSLKNIKIGFSVGYEREFTLSYPISLATGLHFASFRGAELIDPINNRVSNNSLHSIEVPISAKIYLNPYPTTINYYLKPEFVNTINYVITKYLDNYDLNIKRYLPMYGFSIGIDYLMNENFGGRFSIYYQNSLGSISHDENGKFNLNVFGIKCGLIF